MPENAKIIFLLQVRLLLGNKCVCICLSVSFGRLSFVCLSSLMFVFLLVCFPACLSVFSVESLPKYKRNTSSESHLFFRKKIIRRGISPSLPSARNVVVYSVWLASSATSVATAQSCFSSHVPSRSHVCPYDRVVAAVRPLEHPHRPHSRAAAVVGRATDRHKCKRRIAKTS